MVLLIGQKNAAGSFSVVHATDQEAPGITPAAAWTTLIDDERIDDAPTSFNSPALDVSTWSAVWVLIAFGLVRVIVANESAVHFSSGRLQRIETIAADQATSAKKLIELASLSDQAKSLIFQEQERETLRETIHADIIRQDYTEAERLIDSIESRYGYGMEASRLREELDASRRATLDEKIDTAIARMNEIIDRQDWARATREAQRLMQTFPNHPKTVGLVKRVEGAHTHRKRTLLEAYRDAVAKKDVERGVELLKELDRYLSPVEAAALEESARGVFRAKLHNLGVQFAIFVTDGLWDEAIASGMEIIRDFPNSRMAHEVSEKMDKLHTNAAAAKNDTAPADTANS